MWQRVLNARQRCLHLIPPSIAIHLWRLSLGAKWLNFSLRELSLEAECRMDWESRRGSEEAGRRLAQESGQERRRPGWRRGGRKRAGVELMALSEAKSLSSWTLTWCWGATEKEVKILKQPKFSSFGIEEKEEEDWHSMYSRQLAVWIWNSGEGLGQERENPECS